MAELFQCFPHLVSDINVNIRIPKSAHLTLPNLLGL